MKNPEFCVCFITCLRAWFRLSRNLLAMMVASLMLVSPALAVGAGGGNGSKPVLSTKVFDYYLSGSPANISFDKPATQMTVLMGGGLDVDKAFEDMIRKARGSSTNKVDVVVIRASGADDYNTYLLNMEGVDSVETLVIKSSSAFADLKVNEKIISVMSGADVLFIAGGDQWNYISQWNETSLEKTIKNVLLPRHVPIGGTSAGLAVLGSVDFSAQNGTITSLEALSNPYAPRLTLDSTFLETLPRLQNTIVDSHLVSRDRMGRLVTFLARMITMGIPWHTARAIGVDDGTAVVIDGDVAVVHANSAGTGAAYFLKLPQDPGPTLVVKAQTPLEVSSVQVDKITGAVGDRFDMANWLRTNGSVYFLFVYGGVLYGKASPY